MTGGPRRKAAVIGWPAAHSLSPRVHGYWLNQYGIAGEYGILEVPPHDLERTLRDLGRLGYCGANLTLPHKESALAYMDDIDPSAHLVGAVNTVEVLSDGRLRGYNSDVQGFRDNIKTSPHYPALKKNHAVVLGAGGAARAVCAALAELGFKRLTLCNRTRERAERLTHQISNSEAVDWESRHAALKDADMLVNATSLGMQGKAPLDLCLDALPRSALVADIVYAPLYTDLIRRAAAKGNPVADGLGMLLHQARLGFALWFGRDPEVTEQLRREMMEQL